MNALRLYQNAYKNQPFITHAIETGIIMTSADIISQVFIEKKDLNSVDIGRSLRFGGIGVCIVAPGRAAWYKVLERKFPGATTHTVVLKKFALDQICFAPVFVFTILTSVCYANGMNTQQVSQKIQNSYTEIWLNNIKVWPCVQLCNFYLVPPHLRMTTVQFVSLLWNIYLSWKANVNKSLQ